MLEGVNVLLFRNALKYLIFDKRFFDLFDLNNAIENFAYTDEQCLDKPSRIERSSSPGKIDFKMNQTAASMIWLTLLMPFFVGSFVPDDDVVWNILILLRKINILMLSPIVNEETSFLLNQFLASFLSNFSKIFPSAPFTPKCHYAIHLVSQILAYGPLRNTWCMRFEGMNGLMKRQPLRSFNNICKQLAERHQRWQCLEQIEPSGNPRIHFLYGGDTMGTVVSVPMASSPFNAIDTEADTIFVTSFVKIYGRTYKIGTVIVDSLYSSENDAFVSPVFLRILKIGVLNNEKYFSCERLSIDYYSDHYGAFKISSSGSIITKKYLDLKFNWPQLVNFVDGDEYVTLVYVPEII
jgi:hypothetical protein